VFLSNTSHEEDQPIHLTLKSAAVPIEVNLDRYDAPEQRYWTVRITAQGSAWDEVEALSAGFR
jgi:hypothetical protein